MARLQLALPFVLPQTLTQLLRCPLLGAGICLVIDGEPTVVRLHTLQRVIDEVLRYEPAGALSVRGWLPLGACGRRGTGLYFVDASSGDLDLWRVNGEGRSDGERAFIMQTLGQGLPSALVGAVAAADATARRRLPDKRAVARRVSRSRVRPTATQLSLLVPEPPQNSSELRSSRRAAERTMPGLATQRCPRTLSLF